MIMEEICFRGFDEKKKRDNLDLGVLKKGTSVYKLIVKNIYSKIRELR